MTNPNLHQLSQQEWDAWQLALIDERVLQGVKDSWYVPASELWQWVAGNVSEMPDAASWLQFVMAEQVPYLANEQQLRRVMRGVAAWEEANGRILLPQAQPMPPAQPIVDPELRKYVLHTHYVLGFSRQDIIKKLTSKDYKNAAEIVRQVLGDEPASATTTSTSTTTTTVTSTVDSMEIADNAMAIDSGSTRSSDRESDHDVHAKWETFLASLDEEDLYLLCAAASDDRPSVFSDKYTYLHRTEHEPRARASQAFNYRMAIVLRRALDLGKKDTQTTPTLRHLLWARQQEYDLRIPLVYANAAKAEDEPLPFEKVYLKLTKQQKVVLRELFNGKEYRQIATVLYEIWSGSRSKPCSVDEIVTQIKVLEDKFGYYTGSAGVVADKLREHLKKNSNTILAYKAPEEEDATPQSEPTQS